MEFRMVPAEVKIPELTFNFDELKTELTERLTYYNGLVVTEDAIKEAKADRAALNKLKDALDEKRKEVKRQCLAPYEAFEKKIKELTALVDQPISAIDTQLKAFEAAKKEEKQAAIVEAYNGLVGEYLRTVMPLERIQKKNWLNATYQLNKIREEIAEVVVKITCDLEALNAMDVDAYSPAVRAKYVETLDLGAALAHRKSLVAASEAFNRAGAVQAPTAHETHSTPTQEPVTTIPEPVAPAVAEKLYLLRLEFQLTIAQSERLKSFLTNEGIKYRKIEKN